MGYPTFLVILRVGYGMGYAKWDMQKEVSQAGQISFGEVKWDRLAWPLGSSRLFLGLVRIGLPSISNPVPRPLSLSLPVPPALCPCFCLLPLGRSQPPAHTHLRPLNDQLYAGHPHYSVGKINSHACIQLSHKGLPQTLSSSLQALLWTLVLL